ncbi:hypothetical protein I307_02163 [Cryptococcus deuterogattii 99/473]|uniref:Uncharacterized protein n=1 Tax=Cryptococcus deuterogattii Ram5 TaxID=1296110 RepID=A0A0D0TXY0_9TREE|nr:hypothetical protein I309_05759 [Cryptococcus deuterogattii LA55]KIR33720.1 hypothetical protein I352_03797 [Cryptococcus deuterogattii MMRL2647]KIR40728.1 hypothetical protein I313_03384 [Cryptococcus deuterogattii Ram5]KIR74409.1 hypothetical protein I310_02016 [Cryptococcus deuterogattii CA1014]KIR94102.1 hypothetical protein I304_01734 [Cryptococcus deuterogattii CBS 10090]KIS01109.1 hypothetical protein L804_00978 [Cryptococcus deuterogattii 2001/935-1]KIY58364.1 hypothetical protein 
MCLRLRDLHGRDNYRTLYLSAESKGICSLISKNFNKVMTPNTIMKSMVSR